MACGKAPGDESRPFKGVNGNTVSVSGVVKRLMSEIDDFRVVYRVGPSRGEANNYRERGEKGAVGKQR